MELNPAQERGRELAQIIMTSILDEDEAIWKDNLVAVVREVSANPDPSMLASLVEFLAAGVRISAGIGAGVITGKGPDAPEYKAEQRAFVQMLVMEFENHALASGADS
jgi:hypothetical protein